jgi:hypothetical protein
MPMSAVANIATVGLVRELLDVEDTTSLVAKLGSLPDSDVQTFLDFIIYVSSTMSGSGQMLMTVA